jgi:hypothetical protein
MLDAARQQALALDYDELTQPIDAPHSGVLRPPQRIPHPRDRKASFIVFLLTLNGLDHGIDKMPDLTIDVVDKNAAAHPDLVSCQARTPRRGNGLFQISYEVDEQLIELGDGIAGGAEYWITEETDGTLGHGAILPGRDRWVQGAGASVATGSRTRRATSAASACSAGPGSPANGGVAPGRVTPVSVRARAGP